MKCREGKFLSNANYFRTAFCFLLVIMFSTCSRSDDTLEGRWEMFVGKDNTLAGQINGTDGLIYVIELNSKDRNYIADGLLGDRKSYGYMDFSNASRIYHYDIDSVACLGGGSYLVKAIDSNRSLESLDTLYYNSETQQLTYKDWAFNYVPDLKPFIGEWVNSFKGEELSINLSLYEKIKAPKESPYNGVECYGWITYTGEVDNSYRLITKVEQVHYNSAIVLTIFPDYPDDEPQRHYLAYYPGNGNLSYDESVLQPTGGAKLHSSAEDESQNKPFGSSWGDKFLILWSIILLVALYYVFKIFLGYALWALGSGAVGAAVGGLILWLLMGGFGLDLPRWLIITIMSVTVGPMALIGLWEAIKNTGEIAKSPFASKIAKGMMRSGKTEDGYIVDEYGNKKKITSVERGILGEKYIKTEDGENFMNNGGNEVHKL